MGHETAFLQRVQALLTREPGDRGERPTDGVAPDEECPDHSLAVRPGAGELVIPLFSAQTLVFVDILVHQ